MPSSDIPFIRPQLPSGEQLAEDLRQIVEANWYTNFGPFERRFRAAVEDYLGDGMHVATFANATLGLLGALTTLVDRNDGLVLVPSFTFAAGPAAVQWCGLRPLFVDIDPVNLQPSLVSARRAVARHGDEIVAVLLCNSFGIGTADIREWEALCTQLGVPLVIDSAAGFGSSYPDGTRLGSAGSCEVFSFHATKPFAIGEGGAVATRDAELAERLRAFSNFGFQGPEGAGMLGLNGKLQELNAAIGLRQLEGFDDALARRRQVLADLRAGLEPLGLLFPPSIEHSSVCFASALVPHADRRDDALASLRHHGIEARAYYSPAVHLQEQFADALHADDLAGTAEAGARILSLPVHHSMTVDDIERICDAVAKTGVR